MLILNHVKCKGNKVSHHMANAGTFVGTRIINDEPARLHKEAFMSNCLALASEDMSTHTNSGPADSIMALQHTPKNSPNGKDKGLH